MRLPHVLVLALWLLGFGLAQVAAEPTTTPMDLLAIQTLQPAASGHQNDAGFAFPDDVKLLRIVAVPIVQDRKTGALYFVDPEDLVDGKVSLRPWLVAVAANGTITSSKRATALVKAETERRLRIALLGLRSEVASRLPSDLAAMAPQIIATVTRVLLGLKPLALGGP